MVPTTFRMANQMAKEASTQPLFVNLRPRLIIIPHSLLPKNIERSLIHGFVFHKPSFRLAFQPAMSWKEEAQCGDA